MMDKKKIIVLSLTGILLLLPFIIETPSGLSTEGFRALFIFFISILWWISEIVPLMITSIFSMSLLLLMKVSEPEKILSKFGNSAVFFVLGALILSSAFMRSGLNTRFALFIIRQYAKNSLGLIYSIFFISSFLTVFISSHAVVAMMFPLVLEISHYVNNEKFSKLLFLSAMWGSILTSSLTFLGGARAILAVEIMRSVTGRSIDFLLWVKMVFPIIIVELSISMLILFFLNSRIRVDIGNMREKLYSSTAKWSPKEKKTLIVLILAISLWILFGNTIGLVTISLLVVVLIFLLNLVSWKEVEEDVNWGIILMYGGAIVLGSVINDLGISNWLLKKSCGFIDNPKTFLFLIIMLSVILTELMSNSAVVALILPVIVSSSSKLGISPEIFTLSISVGSGLALMLPMSTPAVALTISSGRVNVKDTIKYGLLLSFTGIIMIFLTANTLWLKSFPG